MLSLLGVAVAQNPVKYKNLLERYRINVPHADKVSLTNGILHGLSMQSEKFNKELTVHLSDMVESTYLPEGNEDNYVEAIAGAITGISGAVGSIVNGKNQQKMAREQARREMLNNMMMIKADQQKAASEGKKQAGRQNMYIIIAVLGLLMIFFFLKQRS